MLTKWRSDKTASLPAMRVMRPHHEEPNKESEKGPWA
jgi:hypothetical protein